MPRRAPSALASDTKKALLCERCRDDILILFLLPMSGSYPSFTRIVGLLAVFLAASCGSQPKESVADSQVSSEGGGFVAMPATPTPLLTIRDTVRALEALLGSAEWTREKGELHVGSSTAKLITSVELRGCLLWFEMLTERGDVFGDVRSSTRLRTWIPLDQPVSLALTQHPRRDPTKHHEVLWPWLIDVKIRGILLLQLPVQTRVRSDSAMALIRALGTRCQSAGR